MAEGIDQEKFWEKYLEIESREKRAVFILETIDDLVLHRKYDEVDSIIKYAPIDKLSVGDTVFLLTYTLWTQSIDDVFGVGLRTGFVPKHVRHKYPSRDEVFEKCKQKCIEERGEEKTERLFKRLK